MEFGVLGPLTVHARGRAVELGGRLQCKVLAVLLAHRGETVSSRDLIGAVWWEDAEVLDPWELTERKRPVLQTYISRLRSALEPGAGGATKVIETEGTGYRLRVADDDLDETRFRTLADLGRAALERGDAATAADRLAEALELWRGPPLGELATEPFARQLVERLETLHAGVIEAKIDADLRLGRQHELIGNMALRRWVDERPEHEGIRAGFVLALARCGRKVAAINLCREGITYLREHQGIESGVLSALLNDLIDDTLPATGSQLTHDHRAASQAGPQPFFMVPTPIGHVIPRAGLAGELIERLRAAAGGLVAAVGAGGFGKTTLVLDACRRAEVRELFPDGIFWVTAGESADDYAIAAKINDLSAHLSGARPALSDPMQAGFHLARLLGDQRFLLVVDDVWYPDQLVPLLQGAPRCTRLITTRNRAILPDTSAVVTVDTMAPDEAGQMLTYGLPELGADRAAALAARTGGWPLLVMLVNSQLRGLVRDRGMTAAEAAVEVLAELRAAGPTALDAANPTERRQAVESTVRASLTMLEAAHPARSRVERFLELAVFGGQLDVPRRALETLWARTAGWDEVRVRRFCEELAAVSLVQSYSAGPPRLRFHDLMQEYLRHVVGADRLKELHAELLAAYRAALGRPGGGEPRWTDLSADEPYLWNRLAHHLREAGHRDELDRTVTDPRYGAHKIAHAGTVAYEADLALAATPTSMALRDLVRRSAHLLPPDDPVDVLEATLRSRARGLGLAWSGDSGRPYLAVEGTRRDQVDAMLHRVLAADGGAVYSVRFSPDGTTVASAGESGTVFLWDNTTGRLKFALAGGVERINRVAFSPDGTMIASGGGDGRIRLYDVRSGALVFALAGQHADVTALAFHPDGHFLASASVNGTVRVWDTGSGLITRKPAGHEGAVWRVEFSPDGAVLASAGDDGKIRLWGVSTGELRWTLAGPHGPVQNIAFSSDSLSIVAGTRNGVLTVWNAATGRLLHTLHGHMTWIRSVAFGGADRLIASASWDGMVKVWDATSGGCLHRLRGRLHSAEVAVFSPDGSILATAGDGGIHLWAPRTGRLRAILSGHTKAVSDLAFSRDGDRLASAGSDGTVRLWRPAVDEPADPPATADDVALLCVAAAVGGRMLATGGQDGAVRLHPEDGESRTLGRHRGRVHSVSFSRDGRRLISGGADGRLMIWPVDAAASTPVSPPESAPVSAIGPRPASGPGAGRVLAELGVAVRVVASCRDGRLVSAGDDGILRFWDIETGEPVGVWPTATEQITAMACTLDGRYVALGGNDGIVWVRDSVTGESIRTLAAFTQTITALAFDPSGAHLAASGQGGTLRLWDLPSGRRRHLTGHRSLVEAVAFQPVTGLLASAGQDGTVRLWSAVTGRLHTGIRVDDALFGLTWAQDTRLVGVGRKGMYAFRPENLPPSSVRPEPGPR
jgi:WD40 repeat protein/DNA-binding SARP family transcriptional activator